MIEYSSNNIAVYMQNNALYPDFETGFRPSTCYPEYLFGVNDISKCKNETYEAVRESFHLLGLDKEHYGKKNWNPLQNYVQKGNTVLIKPNLVMHKNASNKGDACLYTHPSILAPIIDYVLIALEGEGQIIVGDAPMQSCDFGELIQNSGYDRLIQWYKDKGYPIKIVDFRNIVRQIDNGREVQKQTNNSGVVVNLANKSEFAEKNNSRFRITNYDPRNMRYYHNKQDHKYVVSEYILNADVIINVPKPKCHRKAGVTISLKNMVGVITQKECLPHHTMGSAESGGDEYERRCMIKCVRSHLEDIKNFADAVGLRRLSKYSHRLVKKCTAIIKNKHIDSKSEGSWYGNQTISRTVLDINKIVLYADKQGILNDTRQRKVLIIGDMIIAGEGDGPLAPSPKQVGAVIIGDNPVCYDEVVATMMGFDISKIPTLANSRKLKYYKIVDKDITPFIISNDATLSNKKITEIDSSNCWNFLPPTGWRNHIEL